MYGPYIQDGRKKKPTYLLAYIDDASRLVPHGEFYYTQSLEALRHSFKEAVLKRGIPTLLYTDYTEELTMPKDFHNADQYPVLPEKHRHSFC